MEYSWDKDGITWSKTLDSGGVISIVFREMRRERTGVHALVAILHGNAPLGYDNFNIARQEERVRLSRAAHRMLAEVSRAEYKEDQLRHDLDRTCLEVPKMWEEDRLEISRFDHSQEPENLTFILKPYVLLGGGTIHFAPPGSGKSYLLQTQAISIASGSDFLWDCAPSPVCYINLERSARSLMIRERALLRCMGLSAISEVHYLHARGAGLASISRRCRKFVQDNPGCVGMLDSISRTGVGGLNEDTTANAVTDMLNGTFDTWVALGHTSKANPDAVFGSQHWTAGADVVVQVASQSMEKKLGLRLHIKKANDIGVFPAEYMLLEFESAEGPVHHIRRARQGELPELSEGQESLKHLLVKLLREEGSKSAKGAADDLGANRTRISHYFRESEEFHVVGREGKETLYALRDTSAF